jgi:poly(A) polymerase
VSPNALRAVYRLHANGFIAYPIGGCVRDLLLGRTPKDFDIGTNATPRQVKRLFRNCRLIGRRFRLAHLHFQDEIVEVSTFRRAALPSDDLEEEETGHRRRLPRHVQDEEGMVLADNVFGTPEEDALRRDFTINALAYNCIDSSVIDYCTGMSDLEKRLIRPIGDPRVRFTEDPVRMLRAVRFAASCDLDIEPAAWECICELSPIIARVSPARLYEEVQKLFFLGSVRPTLRLLEKSGLLAGLFPDLARWLQGNGTRRATLDEHLGCLDRLHAEGTPASPALALAAIFGPLLEEAVIDCHRDGGVPHQQALDAVCGAFMREVSGTVCVPRRIGSRVRAVLALKSALCRKPVRRPASVAAKPEFPEGLAYLRFSAQMNEEHQRALGWWDAFLAKGGDATPDPEPPAGDASTKRRRRRRHRRRGRQTAA